MTKIYDKRKFCCTTNGTTSGASTLMTCGYFLSDFSHASGLRVGGLYIYIYEFTYLRAFGRVPPAPFLDCWLVIVCGNGKDLRLFHCDLRRFECFRNFRKTALTIQSDIFIVTSGFFIVTKGVLNAWETAGKQSIWPRCRPRHCKPKLFRCDLRRFESFRNQRKQSIWPHRRTSSLWPTASSL